MQGQATLVWLTVLPQSVHLDSESTNDTPTHHHNEQNSSTEGPMHNIRCESSHSSQSCVWSRKWDWSQCTDDMHSLYALTTAQCCSRDGDRIASYSIANGNQCDVIAHTRGKAGDVIAAPRHICSLPLVTGRAPQNVDCEVHWFKAGLGNLPWKRNAGLLCSDCSNCWGFWLLCDSNWQKMNEE